MPRKQEVAPNARVVVPGMRDQRRAVELEYDKKFPDRKHFWKYSEGDSLKHLVKEGLVTVVTDSDDTPVTNGKSSLCWMSRELWDARARSVSEYSYERVKEIRGHFDEFHVPLRQFANFKTPTKE